MTAPVKPFGQRVPPKPQDPYASQWHIRVGDRIYGPYTGYQLNRFHAEGRFAGHTMVSREGVSSVDAQWHTAASDATLGAMFRVGAQVVANFGRQAKHSGSKYVLIIDLKSRPTSELEAGILALGRAHRVGPNVWLFHGAHTISNLRNHLGEFLGQGDSMLIVDADHARTAGYNMGPENDSLVRQVWSEDEGKN